MADEWTARDAEGLATSRLARGAQLGGLAAKHTLRRVTVKAGSVVVTERRRTRMLDQANERKARDFVGILANMRGAAMKIGQLLSVVDLGIVDESAREYFRQRLSKLHGSINAMPFDAMRPVSGSELGAPVERLFGSFDTEAFAPASIGRAYRAVPRDGRERAGKVHDPGGRAAVQADQKYLPLLLRMVNPAVPTVAARAFLDAISCEFPRELDYRQQLASQARVAQRYAHHP